MREREREREVSCIQGEERELINDSSVRLEVTSLQPLKDLFIRKEKKGNCQPSQLTSIISPISSLSSFSPFLDLHSSQGEFRERVASLFYPICQVHLELPSISLMPLFVHYRDSISLLYSRDQNRKEGQWEKESVFVRQGGRERRRGKDTRLICIQGDGQKGTVKKGI